jgi:hypothetical protein
MLIDFCIFQFVFYDAQQASEKIKSIITAMKPHFSSASGTYYSEDLFFLSLGLYLISPLQKVALIDLDTEFRADPANLFQFFDLFTDQQIFGLGPELSPVYKHVFFKYLHDLKDNPKNVSARSLISKMLSLIKQKRNFDLFNLFCRSENQT